MSPTMRRLGDDEPAAVLAAAADQAPDAPFSDRPLAPAVPIPGRTAVLALAREVIDRHRRR